MRKDVKLGFAVGGVLLAVLIVYVLVVPGGKDQRLSSAQGEASSSGDGGVKLEPVAPTTQAGGGAVAQNTQQPPPAPPVTVDAPPPPPAGTDPFEAPKADEAVASSNSNTRGLDWNKLLNDPRAPTLLASDEKPAASPATPPSADAGAGAPDAGSTTPDITQPGPTPIVAPAPTSAAPPKSDDDAVAVAPPPPASDSAAATPPVAEPATPGSGDTPTVAKEPAGTTTANNSASNQQQTHVVESGESFSSIAIRYYGNANLYPALMRANPSIDPVKLRPGMKVNVPPLSEVRPAASGTAVSSDAAQMSSTKVETPIDPATQYRVQTGDNLYSIAKKLYGRGDRSGRLYEANKAVIGEDMNNLKVGQVLTLPDPPTKR